MTREYSHEYSHGVAQKYSNPSGSIKTHAGREYKQ